MLTLSGSLRVFLALEPCDMRKTFDSLHALVVSQLGEDPHGGAVFGFVNKTRTRIKLLHWDGTGCGFMPSDWKKAPSPGRNPQMATAEKSNSPPKPLLYSPMASTSKARKCVSGMNGNEVHTCILIDHSC